MTLSVCQLRPQSRGSIALASADPFDRPRIHANYLAVESDRRFAVESIVSRASSQRHRRCPITSPPR